MKDHIKRVKELRDKWIEVLDDNEVLNKYNEVFNT